MRFPLPQESSRQQLAKPPDRVFLVIESAEALLQMLVEKKTQDPLIIVIRDHVRRIPPLEFFGDVVGDVGRQLLCVETEVSGKRSASSALPGSLTYTRAIWVRRDFVTVQQVETGPSFLFPNPRLGQQVDQRWRRRKAALSR